MNVSRVRNLYYSLCLYHSMRWLIGLLCILVISLASVAGQPGIALSSPTVERLIIDSFPFTYQNQIRVYNQGTDERVFVISVSAPYQDILDWVAVDTSVFTLPPGKTKVIQFSIYAESGYYGEYEIVFKPTLLPTETSPTPDSAMAHIAMSAAYTLTIVVPEDIAPERPPEEEKEPESPRELTKTVQDMDQTKASTVRPFDKPLLINVPKEIYQYEPTFLSVEFVEGEEPADLGFLIIAPSGKSYELNSETTFSFDEKGTWSVLIVIQDEIIAGNPVDVYYNMSKDMQYRILPKYGIFLVAAVVIVCGLVIWRRRT
jgi:hypothetical protein